MRKALFLLVMSLPVFADAQFGLNIGIKAGVNFANVTKASEINTGNHTGYLVGGYISPKPKKAIGFRSEIILSRQGYDYKTNTNTGNVNLDYLLLPQLITINFSKRIQVHAGGQIAFLLNADVDSTNGGTPGSLMSYFSRFEYGLAGGVDVFPLKFGLFLGARINISLNQVSVGGSQPNFIPSINAKNNVVQVYAGWRL